MEKNIYEVKRNGQVVDYMLCGEICELLGVSKQQVLYAATYGKELKGHLLDVVDKKISKNSKVCKEWDRFHKQIARKGKANG